MLLNQVLEIFILNLIGSKTLFIGLYLAIKFLLMLFVVFEEDIAIVIIIILVQIKVIYGDPPIHIFELDTV